MPPKLRRAAVAGLARAEVTRAERAAARARPTPEGATVTARPRAAAHPGGWARRCATCGDVLPSYAAAERHADAHGGARLEIDL